MNRFATLLCLLVLLVATSVNAQQLTGTKNVPGDYPSLVSALSDIKQQGVGEGGITIRVTLPSSLETPQIVEAYTMAIDALIPVADLIDVQVNSDRTVRAVIQMRSGENVTITGFNSRESTLQYLKEAGVSEKTESAK